MNVGGIRAAAPALLQMVAEEQAAPRAGELAVGSHHRPLGPQPVRQHEVGPGAGVVGQQLAAGLDVGFLPATRLVDDAQLLPARAQHVARRQGESVIGHVAAQDRDGPPRDAVAIRVVNVFGHGKYASVQRLAQHLSQLPAPQTQPGGSIGGFHHFMAPL